MSKLKPIKIGEVVPYTDGYKWDGKCVDQYCLFRDTKHRCILLSPMLIGYGDTIDSQKLECENCSHTNDSVLLNVIQLINYNGG